MDLPRKKSTKANVKDIRKTLRKPKQLRGSKKKRNKIYYNQTVNKLTNDDGELEYNCGI